MNIDIIVCVGEMDGNKMEALQMLIWTDGLNYAMKVATIYLQRNTIQRIMKRKKRKLNWTTLEFDGLINNGFWWKERRRKK